MQCRKIPFKMMYSQLYELSAMVKALFLRLNVGMKDDFHCDRVRNHVTDSTVLNIIFSCLQKKQTNRQRKGAINDESI